MSWWILTTIGFFTISSYFVNGNPIPLQTTNFKDLKNNFTKYRDNLLNENVLPFLKYCYNPNCCQTNDDLLCPSYFELVRQFNESNVLISTVDQQNFIKEYEQISSTINTDEFCKKFSKCIPDTKYTSKHTQNEIIELLNESCDLFCTKIEWNRDPKNRLTIKPICGLVARMFEKLTLANTSQKAIETTISSVGIYPKDIKPVEETSQKIKSDDANINSAKNEEVSNSTQSLAKTGTDEGVTNSILSVNKNVNNKDQINKIENKSQNNGVKSALAEEMKNKIQQNQKEQAPKNINSQQIQKSQQQSINQEQQTENHQEQPQKSEQPHQPQQPEQPQQPQQPEHPQQPQQPEQPQQPQQKQQDDQQPQGPDLNDLGDEQVEDSLKTKDLNMYSEDEEDDSTTNDIFKTNLNNKNSEIEQRNNQKIINDDQLSVSSSFYEKKKNSDSENVISTDPFYEESGSNFFVYFLIAMFICMISYVLYHNKSKILALVIEGRRSQSKHGKTRRKHLAGYRKLDTNLEEAITSSSAGSTGGQTHIIY